MTTMIQTTIIKSDKKLPKLVWDKAASWSIYTKNCVLHKTLKGKSLIEKCFLNKTITNKQANLQLFWWLVSCYDYTTKDKLTPRKYWGQILGYTLIHGVYLVIRQGGWVTIYQNPTPVLEASNESSLEDDITSDKDQPNTQKKKEPKKPKPKWHWKTPEEFTKL